MRCMAQISFSWHYIQHVKTYGYACDERYGAESWGSPENIFRRTVANESRRAFAKNAVASNVFSYSEHFALLKTYVLRYAKSAGGKDGSKQCFR